MDRTIEEIDLEIAEVRETFLRERLAYLKEASGSLPSSLVRSAEMEWRVQVLEVEKARLRAKD